MQHAAIIRAILIGHCIDVHDGVLAWLHACEVEYRSSYVMVLPLTIKIYKNRASENMQHVIIYTQSYMYIHSQ